MENFSNKFARWVIKFRWLIIFLTILVTALAFTTFKNLYYNSSNELYFLNNDKSLIDYKNLIERFGDPEYLSIGISKHTQDKDIFSENTIKLVDSLTSFLEDQATVTQVRSLTKYQYIHTNNGILSTDYLFTDIDAISGKPDILNKARSIMKNEKLALGKLLTKDFHHTRIVARTEYHPENNTHNVELVNRLREYIYQQGFENRGYKIHLSGTPVINERFETLTKRDSSWINPLMTVIMIIILAIIFRTVTATLTPWLIIGATIAITTGIQATLHWPITPLSSVLIPTMIVIGLGSCVHILFKFYKFQKTGLEATEAAKSVIACLFMPITFTSITTAAGFAALSITELVPVRQFALLASIGTIVILLLSLTTLPALLSLIPSRKKFKNNNSTGYLDRLADFIPAFTARFGKIITIVGFVIAIIGTISITQIRVDSNMLNFFKQDNWVNQDLRYFEQHYRGTTNIEITIDSGAKGGIKDPAILSSINSLQNYLENLAETGRTTSALDFLKQISQALHDGNPNSFILPDSRELAAQYLLLYENSGPDEDLSDLKDFHERFLRIIVPVINMDASDMAGLLQDIRRTIDTRYSNLNVEISGPVVMSNVQNTYINNGMVRAFSIAILIIACCMFILFRSIKYGFIALIPSVIPVILTGGIIAILGIPINLATMIIGAMTIGITVDDSIHVLSRYLLAKKEGSSVYDAISTAIKDSGLAVIITSIILVTGFSIMVLGSFIPYIHTGLFAAMIMALALAGDLIFIPAILFLLDKPKDISTNQLSK